MALQTYNIDFGKTSVDVTTETAASVIARSTNFKAAVATATTANITLSGEQTLDGVLTSTSRVLVKNQTLPAANGIYVSAAGAWSRGTDLDADGEAPLAIVTVTGGTTQSGTAWYLPEAAYTVGTTAQVWAQLGFVRQDQGLVGDADVQVVIDLASGANKQDVINCVTEITNFMTETANLPA